jgi:hypothetical protein
LDYTDFGPSLEGKKKIFVGAKNIDIFSLPPPRSYNIQVVLIYGIAGPQYIRVPDCPRPQRQPIDVVHGFKVILQLFKTFVF